jgi:hypothetical protein
MREIGKTADRKGLVVFKSKRQVGKREGKVFDGLVESVPKVNLLNFCRKLFNRLVKIKTESYLLEFWWEFYGEVERGAQEKEFKA